MWGGINLFVKSYKRNKTENLEMASELFVDSHIVISTKKNALFSVSSRNVDSLKNIFSSHNCFQSEKF